MRVELAPILAGSAGGIRRSDIQAPTVRAAVEHLEAQYPGFKSRILDDSGRLRGFISVYLNDDDIRFHAGLDTPVTDQDRVLFVPAVAGGL